MTQSQDIHRRRWFARAAAVSAGVAVSPLLHAAERMTTPRQAMGPFYPIELPLDQDNDLVSVRGHSGRPVGELLNVVGQVLDEQGKPLKGVLLEIWQVNGYGRYHHPNDDQNKPYDPNFQGYGRTVTTADGGYRFRTIKPVAYPGRAPHIHFALSSPSFAKFYTQMYLAGAPENETDFLLTRLDRKAQDSLLVSLLKSRDEQKGFAGRFDIVLEKTVLSRGL